MRRLLAMGLLTRDKGEHWYAAQLLDIDPSTLSQPWFVGRGEQLFYARQQGDTVYQLTPLPPPVECTGLWSRSILGEDVDTAGNVCLGPAVLPGTQAVPGSQGGRKHRRVRAHSGRPATTPVPSRPSPTTRTSRIAYGSWSAASPI